MAIILIKSSAYAISDGMFSSAFPSSLICLKAASKYKMNRIGLKLPVVLRHSRENAFLRSSLHFDGYVGVTSFHLYPECFGVSQSEVFDGWYQRLETYLFQWYEYWYLSELFLLCTICESTQHLLYCGMAWIRSDRLTDISLSFFLIYIIYIVAVISYGVQKCHGS